MLGLRALRGLGVGAWLALGTGAAFADEPIVTYELPNGLDVVLAPDHRVPKVVMNLRYSVGSMNEPAGRSGFAHLFEHLMFSGTEAWPDVFGSHSAVGNDINAWTMEDGTVYYVEGLASNLPMILSLEADRMANLGRDVDQRELDLQRSVVKNEMRQNVLDRAGGSGWEAFWSGLYPHSHPYSRTVIGSIADLDSATLDDVQGFFASYYLPNNAALVLTGDFEVDDAKALIEQTFGVVPRGADVPRPSAGEPQPTRARVEVKDRLPTPIVILGWTGPDVQSPDNGALAIAAELLGNAETGLLRRRLVSEKGLATYASAAWTPGLLGGRFTVEAGAVPGVEASAIEAELHAAVAEFLAATPADTDVERARRGLLLADRLSAESLRDRAERLAEQADLFGRITYGFGDDPYLTTPTTADVAATASHVLVAGDAGTLVLSPGPRGGYPAVLTDSSGTPEPFAAAERPAVSVPKLEPREPKEAVLPARETATLANGMAVVHYRLPEAPVAHVAAIAKGGWSNAPAGKEGLIAMAASMATRGAGERDYDAFARAAQDIGASVSYEAGQMATALTLSVPPEGFDAGLGLLGDAIRAPRFDAAEWTIAVAEVEDWLARREAELPGVADRAASAVLFPQHAGKPAPDWSPEALRAMTRDDASAALAGTFRPNTVTFVSVGPMSLGEVVASLDKAFGTWIDAGAGFVADAAAPAAFPAGRTVLLVPEPGASQSALYVARPAPGLDEARRNEAVAVSRLLGGDFESRLNTVIREEKGYSYGVDSYLLDVIRTGSALVVATTVERDATGPALAEVLHGFDELATRPVTAGEVNRTVTAYRQALAGEAETAGRLFATLLNAAATGTTLEETHDWRVAKTRLSLGDVAQAAVRMAPLDPSLVVVVGDPDIVKPQLAALGLEQVRVVERAIEPTSRDAALTGDTPPPGPLTSDGAGRSTRTIHGGCAAGTEQLQGCATAAHGE